MKTDAPEAGQKEDWAWEILLAEKAELRDTAWSYLVWHPERAKEVPFEHGSDMVISGINSWQCSTRLNATSLAKCSHEVLKASMVNSKFMTYRDAFLFGIMLAWGLQAQSFDLSPEQSEAVFSVARIITNEDT